MSENWTTFFCLLILTTVSRAHPECRSKFWMDDPSSAVPENLEYKINEFSDLNGNELVQKIQELCVKQNDSRIVLKFLGISEIKVPVFSNFTEVHQIDLSYNAITTIEDKTFEENRAIQKISLKQNLMEKLTKHMFYGTSLSLVDLDLAMNRISDIETGTFENLLQLHVLDLSGNCLKFMKEFTFRNNMKLKEIFLNENQIVRIDPEIFYSNAELTLLEMSKNKLENFPQLLVKQIKTIDLNDNRIKHLNLNNNFQRNRKSAEFENVYLSNNEIFNITEFVGDRFDITTLDLSHNQISDVSNLISLKNLQRLHLQNNMLSELNMQDIHRQLLGLLYIDISHNSFHCDDVLYYSEMLEQRGATLHSELLNTCNHAQEEIDYDHFVINELRKDLMDLTNETRFIKIWCLVTGTLNLIIFAVYILYRLSRSNKYDNISKGELIDEMEL